MNSHARDEVASGQPARWQLPVNPDGDLRDERRNPRHRRSPRRRPVRRRRFGNRWDLYAAMSGGGALGGLARWGIGQLLPAAPPQFPWATFLVNVLGSFLLGFLMVFILDAWPPSRYARPFLAVGLLSGFTTFSTYMVEARELLADGLGALADAYVLDTLAAGLLAVWLGIVLARLVTGRPLRPAGAGTKGPSR